MKIKFENEKEKNCLAHILIDWFINSDIYDPLGCEPACRDESSPGCWDCIQKLINSELDNNELNLTTLGGVDYIIEHTIKGE